MAAVSDTAGSGGAVRRRTRFQRLKENRKLWRGILAIAIALVLWEIGSRWDQWSGFTLPFIGLIPPPTDVAVAWVSVLPQPGYWESWYLSFKRVLAGFLFAQLIGIPLGARARGQPVLPRVLLPGVRDPASDPAACVGARVAHLLADQRDVHRVRHLPGRVLHHRHQRAGRGAHHRHLAAARRPVDGRDTVGHVLEDRASRHAPLHLHRRRGRHGDHVGGGAGGGDDLRRRQPRAAAASASSSGTPTWVARCRTSWWE